MNSNTFW